MELEERQKHMNEASTLAYEQGDWKGMEQHRAWVMGLKVVGWQVRRPGGTWGPVGTSERITQQLVAEGYESREVYA